MSITDSTVTKNEAKNGGFLYAECNSITIKNSIFYKNTAL